MIGRPGRPIFNLQTTLRNYDAGFSDIRPVRNDFGIRVKRRRLSEVALSASSNNANRLVLRTTMLLVTPMAPGREMVQHERPRRQPSRVVRESRTLFVLADFPGGVALWGAVPPVYDTTTQPLDRGIHIHARIAPKDPKELDQTFRAVRIVSKQLPEGGLYVDELDAIYYMATTVFGYTMRHVQCTYCEYPHLDRDWFCVHPHSRHLCAGRGKHFKDTQTGIGNPICGVRDALGIQTRAPKPTTRLLDISQADYPGGIQIWGSNPAFIWSSRGAEEEGIHVHAFRDGAQCPEVDETYRSVTIDGVTLDPVMVRLLMAQSVLPSLKDRVVAVTCTSCREGILSEGELAFTPVTTHRCNRCRRDIAMPGRLRKTVSNPLPRVLAKLAESAVRAPRKHDLGLLPETI